MRHRLWRLPILLPAMLLASGTVAATAQSPRPFGVGEQARYQVKLGPVSVGSGALDVVDRDTINGRTTLHARMTVSGGIPLARVDDRYESWFEADDLTSRRFRQQIREVRYRRDREYEFFPERGIYRQGEDDPESLATREPLDDLSFLFYARTLPLRVGETYRLNRYFKASGNPVVLRVLRRERVTVPAGTFDCIVVQPTIRTKGLFSEGGRAEVYITDDARRIVVMVKSRVPVVGSLSMYLESYRAAP